MTLDAYLLQEKVTNAEFAERLEEAGHGVTEKWVSRVRQGAAPSRKLALAIQAATNGAVAAAELLGVSLPPSPESAAPTSDGAPEPGA